ncbi:hypothetical protein GCM10010289_84820 [Streptomyces violascens]|nr:hypothetical protein GCM10010289_84820 [Streptomyces violascens]
MRACMAVLQLALWIIDELVSGVRELLKYQALHGSQGGLGVAQRQQFSHDGHAGNRL